MDDVSNFFKSGFLSLHKNAIGKNYQQKTLNDRMNNFHNMRRETRNTLIFQKRNIKENMTPINTPEPSKIIKESEEKKGEKKPNKRLEMLKKWKAEKEKRKQEEKQKTKPLFKVYHVPVEIGLPNLEKVNKEIKGKAISQFAPPNHTFHAPKNLKSVNFNTTSNNSLLAKSSLKGNNMSHQNTTVLQKVTTRATKNKAVESNKLPKRQNSALSQTHVNNVDINFKNNGSIKKNVSNISRVENNSGQQKISKEASVLPQMFKKKKATESKNKVIAAKTTNVNKKCSPPKRSKRTEKIDMNTETNLKLKHKDDCCLLNNEKMQESKIATPATKVRKMPKKNKIKFEEVSNVSKDENPSNVEKQESTKKNYSKTPRKSRKSAAITRKKNVEWNVIEVVDSDDEILSKEINNRTLKTNTKKYNKTPRRGRTTEIIDNTDTEETLRDEDAGAIEEQIPKNNKRLDGHSSSPAHVSPLVMVSRGKANANKEYPLRKSTGSAPITSELNKHISNNVDFKGGKNSFSNKLDETTPKGSHKMELIGDTDIQKSLNNEKAAQEQNSPLTPKNGKKSDANTPSPVYISPFVTVSRSKTSARKEYHVRKSTSSVPNTPEFNKNISDNISPKAGAEYFSKKLSNEIARIEELCKEWNTYRDEKDIPEEAKDMIDVAIGQSKLLISKKFQQFRSLIEQYRNCDYINKPISCEDLHGFWDMIYMQVADLDKRFKNLNNIKENNWKEVVPEKKPIVKRGRGRPTKVTANSSLKDHIKAVRIKKKSDADTETQLLIPHSNEAKVFMGGYYSIKSPIKEQNILDQPIVHPSSTRRSLRVSLLAHQVKNRMSSPGLTMMKVSQAIKCGDGLTPSKSILKSDLTKSAAKITKSVLLKDDLDEDIEENLNSMKSICWTNVDKNKENDINEINLISFSPQTPTRRLQRLSKIN